MAYANTTYTYTSPTLNFVVPFAYLKDSHLSAKVDVSRSGVFVVDTGFTIAADGYSITFGDADTGGAAWVSGTTLVNIYRTTPIGDADRLVDFQAGSVLTEEDLDTSALQVLYASQESADITDTTLKATPLGTTWDGATKRVISVGEPIAAQDAATKNYTDTSPLNRVTPGGANEWDAETEKIVNVVDPTADQDAATKKYVDDKTIASGNLPDVSGGADDNKLLAVQGTAWAKETPTQVRATIDVLSSSEVCARANNLSDLANTTTSRTNLGLGTAATVATGTGASDIALNSSSKVLELRHGSITAGCDFGDAGFNVPYFPTGGGSYGGSGGLTDDAARLTLKHLVVVNESGDTSPTLEDSDKSLQLPSAGGDMWKICWGFAVLALNGPLWVSHGLTDEDGAAIDGEDAFHYHGRTLAASGDRWEFNSCKILDMSTQDTPIKINFRVWSAVNPGSAYATFVAADSYMMVERLPGTPS